MALILMLLGLTSSTTGMYLISSDVKAFDRSSCQLKNYTFFDHTPFSYIIEEPKICSGEVFMLNYVQSSSDHFDRRNLIRETWGSMKFVHSQPVRLLFVVGRPASLEIQNQIRNESQYFRDVVQADFQDTYRNLTRKHIVALHWIDKYCAHAKFISKSDDDTFVEIFSLVEFFEENMNPTEKFIYGGIGYDSPIRTPGSKWTVTKEEYEPEIFPPNAKGSGYIISKAAIKPLLICSFYRKYLFIDDVFIGGLVAEIANVTRTTFIKNYGHIWLKNGDITEDDFGHLFYIGMNQVVQSQWVALWKLSLKMVV